MATGSGNDQGKQAFVREVLQSDPQANEKVVNDAWNDAGHDGRISGSSVSKVRSEMGLVRTRKSRRRVESGVGAFGQPPPGAARRGRKRGRPLGSGKRSQAQANGATAPAEPARMSESATRAGGRGRNLEQLEGELDRLLFRVMNVGALPEVEDALRRARRLVVLSTRNT